MPSGFYRVFMLPSVAEKSTERREQAMTISMPYLKSLTRLKSPVRALRPF